MTRLHDLQGLISPFKAKAEMRMHNPKDKGERTSISLAVKTSGVEARPSFGQMPLFHSIIRLVMSSLSEGIIVSTPSSPPKCPFAARDQWTGQISGVFYNRSCPWLNSEGTLWGFRFNLMRFSTSPKSTALQITDRKRCDAYKTFLRPIMLARH